MERANASGVHGKTMTAPSAHLRRVDLLEVLGDVQNSLGNVILVQVLATAKVSEQRKTQAGLAGRGGEHLDAHMAQHSRLQSGGKAKERHSA